MSLAATARGIEGDSIPQADKRFADPSCFFSFDDVSWMQASQGPGSGVVGPLSHTPGWDFYEVPLGSSGQSVLHVRRDAPIRLVRVFSRWPSSEPPLAVALRPEGVGVAEIALPKPAVQLSRLLVAVCPSSATLGESAKLIGGGEKRDARLSARRQSGWRANNGDSLIASAAAAAAAADAEAKELESRNSLRWRRTKPWPLTGSVGDASDTSPAKPSIPSALDTAREAVDGLGDPETAGVGEAAADADADGSSPSRFADWRNRALAGRALRRGVTENLTRKILPHRTQASSVGAETRRRTEPAASLVAAAAEAAAEVAASPRKSGSPLMAAAEAAAAEVSPLQAAADAFAAEATLQAAAAVAAEESLQAAAEAVAAEASPLRPAPSRDSLHAAAEAVAAEPASESEPSEALLQAAAEAGVGATAWKDVGMPDVVIEARAMESEADEEAAASTAATAATGFASDDDVEAAGNHEDERFSDPGVRAQEAAPPQEGDGEAPEDISTEEKLRLEVERLRSEMEEHRFALKLAEDKALHAEAEATKMREERDDTIRRLRCAERATMLSDMQVRNLTNEVLDMRRQQGDRRNTAPLSTPQITSFEDVVKSLVTCELTVLRNCTPEERAAAKRKLLLRWHPDKNGGNAGGCGDLATRVVQEMQGRAEWITA